MYKKLNENLAFAFGKGVGSEIYDAMNKASHSVFVLSPYISQGYVDFLLRKQQEGLQVSLMTTTEAQKGKMDEIYRKVILQHRVTDEKRLVFKQKAKRVCLLILAVALIVELINLIWFDTHHHIKSFFANLSLYWRDDEVFLLIIFGILLLAYIFYRLFKRIKVFSYFYNTRFPFFAIPSRYFEDRQSAFYSFSPFVHAKVFVIDRRDVFIGSVNLTRSGIRENIEAFVKVIDHTFAQEIIAEIYDCLAAYCATVDINKLGSYLYREAPY